MDFNEKIFQLSSKIQKNQSIIQTEEATKQAFVNPFIQILGYDVFDPTEVIPEFTSDVGTKKGEKVDYAIIKDGNPIILIECKWINSELNDAYKNQLYRYFSAVNARIAILTNGIFYQFYSDLIKPNKMDDKPFFEFDMLDIKDEDLYQLKKFRKDNFNISELLSSANELKYTGEIIKLLQQQMTDPADDVVKFLASKIYPGKVMPRIMDLFTIITAKAFKQFVGEEIRQTLKSVLKQQSADEHKDQLSEENTIETNKSKKNEQIVTTQEEVEAFFIVKSILRDVVDIKRVFYRDHLTYFAVLLDNTNWKPICRFYFNSKQKQISLFDKSENSTKKHEERFPINDLDDIFAFADQLKNTISLYNTTEKAGQQQ